MRFVDTERRRKKVTTNTPVNKDTLLSHHSQYQSLEFMLYKRIYSLKFWLTGWLNIHELCQIRNIIQEQELPLQF